MIQSFMNNALLYLFLGLTLILSACQTVVLTDVNENSANEAVAHLISQGIMAQKSPGQKGSFSVLVDEADFASSVQALAVEGIPRREYDNLGSIFKKEGVVSTPLEENARLIFALSQEVAGSVALIDGVLAARVHVVLPTGDVFGTTKTPSSAAVFIKHRDGIPIENEIPRIKKLVENSIEGLKYEDISVFLFAASRAKVSAKNPFEDVLGLKVAPSSAPIIWGIFAFLGISLILGIGFVLWSYFGKKQNKDA